MFFVICSMESCVDNKDHHHYNLAKYPCTVFNAHASAVRDVIELRDGTLVSCSTDATIRRWTPNGRLLNSYNGHSVDCLMEVDDHTFLSGSLDCTMKVWNKTTEELLHTVHLQVGVQCLLRLRHNSSFLCGRKDGHIEERRVDNLIETMHTLCGHSDSVLCMCEMSNGYVVSGSVDKTLKVWDMKSKTMVHSLKGHLHWVKHVIELRDSNTIASASYYELIRIWDVSTGKCLRGLKDSYTNATRGLVELSDGTILSGCIGGEVQCWNSKGECLPSSKLSKICCVKKMSNETIVIAHYGTLAVRKTWLR